MSALGRHGGWPCPLACAASHHSCVPKPTSLFPSSSASFRASPVTKAPTSGDGPPVLRVRLWLRATRTALRRLAQCRPQRGFPSKRLRLGGREPRAQGPALQMPGVAGSNPGPHQTHTGDRPPPRGGACAADMTATAVAWPPPASALGPGCVRLPCGRRAGRGGCPLVCDDSFPSCDLAAGLLLLHTRPRHADLSPDSARARATCPRPRSEGPIGGHDRLRLAVAPRPISHSLRRQESSRLSFQNYVLRGHGKRTVDPAHL